MSDRTSVLFVCMGNICRSPMAEGVFLHLAMQRGVADRFEVDSAGTGGWHAGNPPDPRALEVADRNGVKLLSRARQVRAPEDFERFRWLVVMDLDNRARLLSRGAPQERVRLLRSFDPALSNLAPDHPSLEVPDPYYGGPEGFDRVYAMVLAACAGLLDALTTAR